MGNKFSKLFISIQIPLYQDSKSNKMIQMISLDFQILQFWTLNVIGLENAYFCTNFDRFFGTKMDKKETTRVNNVILMFIIIFSHLEKQFSHNCSIQAIKGKNRGVTVCPFWSLGTNRDEEENPEKPIFLFLT